MKFIADGKEVSFPSQGPAGPAGENGKSAYDYAVAGGYTGAEEEFQALLGKLGDEPAFGYAASTRISQLGWYRIYSGIFKSAIINVNNIFSSVGPSDIYALVNFDRYAPRIVILSSSFREKENNIEKITFSKFRLTFDNSKQLLFLDVYYSVNSNNSVACSAIPSENNPTYSGSLTCKNFEPISGDTLPSGETVLLEQEITDIPSGSVVTTPPSNPNLLDNWWFGTGVISQRGITGENITDFSGGPHYTLDRWWMYPKSLWELTPEGIKLSYTEDGNGKYWSLAQPIDRFGPKSNYPLSLPWTVSIMVDDRVCSKTFTPTSSNQTYMSMNNADTDSISSLLFSYQWSGTTAQYPTIAFLFYYTPSVSQRVIKAAKLEIGTQQTLAHKDASGNWVLNDPPPNTALELLKCMRYQIELVRTQDFNPISMTLSETHTSRVFFEIASPVPIVRGGTISYSGNWRLAKFGSTWAAGLPITKMEPYYWSTNIIGLRTYVESGLVLDQMYYLVSCPPEDGETNSLLIDMNL